MAEENDKLVPRDYVIESIKAEIELSTPSRRQHLCTWNILIVVSDSECLDLMVNSAVHEYDERALASDDLRLRRLNGIMLVNRGRTSFRPIPSNVEFCETQRAAVPLNERLATALSNTLTG